MSIMLSSTTSSSVLTTLCLLFMSTTQTTLSLSTSTTAPPRPVAIVTGGTRGIGSGIASALADAGYDLLLTFNVDEEAAAKFAATLKCKTECVGGDISLAAIRDNVFERLDAKFADQPLAVMVHNAGQYVGITSDNADGLTGDKMLSFGDGSLLNEDGTTNFDTLHYYQRLYGEAFVDLCERSLPRMTSGGSLVGISSPSVNAAYYGPDPSYSMPGSGKCLMEYSMRIYALKAAARNINANVVVPGIVRTEAWNKLAKKRGLPDEKEMMKGIVDKIVPMKTSMAPRDIGNAVAFLCSDAGRFITGTVLPVDGGLHLTR
jgi:NAD(P)-dependent dehydrogenase (short-subunit alcohol dehydrogenase family)